MKDTVVLHVNSTSLTARTPTPRICRYVAQTLKLPYVYDSRSALAARSRYHTVLVMYGVLKFSAHREAVLRLHGGASRVIRLENDYAFDPDARMRCQYEAWSTLPLSVLINGGAYVNWNVLTWREPAEWASRPPWKAAPNPTPALFYYGAFRQQRQSSFTRYFDTDEYPVVVSSFRGGKKFKHHFPNVQTVGALKTPAHARRYAATVYIEDDYSHDFDCSPANRFYECLQEQVPMAIDARAADSLRKHGFDVDDFVVDDAQSVRAFIKEAQKHGREQYRRWYRDFERELREQIQTAALK